MLVEISERGPRDGLKTNARGVGERLHFPRGRITGDALVDKRPDAEVEIDTYEYTGRKNPMGQPIFAPVGDRGTRR